MVKSYPMTNENTANAKCTTCCRPVDMPYRRIVDGKIVEGCIDEAHTGHLYGASREWHTRDTARQHRADNAARLTAMLGQPMRGFGLPGKFRKVGDDRPVRTKR